MCWKRSMPTSPSARARLIGLALALALSLAWTCDLFAPLPGRDEVHDSTTSHGTDRPPSTSHSARSSSTAEASAPAKPARPTCGTSRLLEELEQAKRGCKTDSDCVLLWDFEQRDERISANAYTLNRTTARLRDLLTLSNDARPGTCGPSASGGAPQAKCKSGMCELAFDE
jgi:hypothetical protein